MSKNQNELSVESPYRRLAMKHNGLIDHLSLLAKNFHLIPKSQSSRNDDEPLPDSVNEIARSVDLPDDILWDLLQREVLSSPLLRRDIDFLLIYRQILEDADDAIKSKRRTRRPVPSPILSDPWQTWVYLRYMHNQILYRDDGSMINAGKRIYVRALARDVAYQFGIPLTPELRQEIKGIRSTAYNDRRRVRDQGLSLVKVAMQREISQDTIQAYLTP